MPSFTILTPTWNAAAFAREAAASIAAQDFGGEVEHLVLDAASTDGTVAEILAGNPRAVVVNETIRDGLYAALNRGLARAKGSVIAWLNADDSWRPDALSRAAGALEENPDAVLAFGDLEILSAGGSRRVLAHPADVLARCADGDLVSGFVTPLCCFWRREAIRSLGPYDPTLPVVADRDLWYRLASRTPVPSAIRFPGVVGTFREHDASLSSGAKGTHRAIEDHVRLWTRWYRAPEASPRMREAARRLRQSALLDLATRDMRSLRVLRAARSFASLFGSGTGWWRPIAAIPANLRRP